MTDISENITTANIVSSAQSALQSIDTMIRDQRAEKDRISASIAQLVQDRKPLLRIVNAAKGRKPKVNGDQP